MRVYGLALALALLGAFRAHSAPARVLSQYTVGHAYLSRIELVGSQSILEDELELVGQRFATEIGGEYTSAVLWLVTREADVDMIRGVTATDQPYSEWRREWVRIAASRMTVARVSVLQKRYRIDIRFADGRVSVLSDPEGDPFSLLAGGIRYDIVYLFARAIEPHLRYSAADDVVFDVYLNAREKRPRVNTELWRVPKGLSGSSNLSVLVSTEYWFRGAAVPKFYPFGGTPPPLVQSEIRAEEWWCESSFKGFRCGQSQRASPSISGSKTKGMSAWRRLPIRERVILRE